MLKKILFFILLSVSANAENFNAVSVSDNVILQLENGEEAELAGVIIDDAYRQDVISFIDKNLGSVEIIYGENKYNRHGRHFGQVYLGGTWLQGEFVKRGWAIVYPVGGVSMLNEMLELEKAASDGAKGLWKEKPVLSLSELHSNIQKLEGDFRVASGKVKDVNAKKDKIYINFGDDWRTDFTVLVRKKNSKNFEDGFLESLIGKEVLTRGWVEEYNGPMIEIYGDGQVSVVD